MPRDYSNAPHSGRSSRGPSGVVWLFVGILLGLIIAGVFYLKNQNTRRAPLPIPMATNGNTVAATNSNNNPTAANPTLATTPTSPSHAATPTNTPATNKKSVNTQALQTQFDFYSVLPSQKVTGPSGDEDTSQLPKSTPNPPANNSTGQPAAATNTPTTTIKTPSSPPPNPPATPTTASVNPSSAAMPTSSPSTMAPVSVAKPSTKNEATLSTPAQTAPPTATPKPTSNNTKYILQVGVFNNFTDADQLRAQLTLSGFDVNISPIVKNGNTLQQVWVGPFSTSTQAKAVQQQLMEIDTPARLLKKN